MRRGRRHDEHECGCGAGGCARPSHSLSLSLSLSFTLTLCFASLSRETGYVSVYLSVPLLPCLFLLPLRIGRRGLQARNGEVGVQGTPLASGFVVRWARSCLGGCGQWQGPAQSPKPKQQAREPASSIKQQLTQPLPPAGFAQPPPPLKKLHCPQPFPLPHLQPHAAAHRLPSKPHCRHSAQKAAPLE